ncbi:hypothetical protein ACFQV2_08835 [Actinokineospora soli]|uniref:(2Fe-2S) ferredoxin domain-containing protein n=1 Tax=Actinokineospora soli TaxID=1048753 RepID=A0ABW2TIV7_9PSEU
MKVTVCRGCCCGTIAKHPKVDHAGQVERLRAIGARVGATVRLADCLDACETSNVVVVQAPGSSRCGWAGCSPTPSWPTSRRG